MAAGYAVFANGGYRILPFSSTISRTGKDKKLPGSVPSSLVLTQKGFWTQEMLLS